MTVGDTDAFLSDLAGHLAAWLFPAMKAALDKY
jgi:hypothetical protein